MAVFRPGMPRGTSGRDGRKTAAGSGWEEGLRGWTINEVGPVGAGGAERRTQSAAPHRIRHRSEGSAGGPVREQKGSLCDVPGGTCDRRERTHNDPSVSAADVRRSSVRNKPAEPNYPPGRAGHAAGGRHPLGARRGKPRGVLSEAERGGGAAGIRDGGTMARCLPGARGVQRSVGGRC